MEKDSVKERIGSIAKTAADAAGIEFVHAEVVGSKRNLTIRIFIDKPDGVTVEDCANVSREIEAVLDADDFIPSAYVLEVSSPGIERGLYTLNDFQKFSGKLAKIKADIDIEGQKNFIGTIQGVEDQTVIFDDTIRGILKIPFSSIAKANLRIDLGSEFKKNADRRSTKTN
jgi:ribosome maturation factor RimP